MFTDTEILDWLDSKTMGYGSGIVFRMSALGRGWRLHETSRTDGHPPMSTVREAVIHAMLEDRR